MRFVGRVVTATERNKETLALQVWADPRNSEHNTIVGYGDPKFRVAEDDYVRVQGTVEGEFKGKNAFGAEVTGPIVDADMLKVVDATAAAPPALATLPAQSQTKAEITITIRKVELAAAETRVFNPTIPTWPATSSPAPPAPASSSSRA